MENSREAFKDILVNALSKRYLAEIRGSDETDAASSRHYREMGKILSHRLSKKGAPISYKRRALIALFLAAAILLLGGFGVMAYEEIKSAFRESVEENGEDQSFIRFTMTEVKGEIQETYLPTYLPEGFELLWENIGFNFVERQYKTSDDNYIDYTQYAPMQEEYNTVMPESKFLDFTYNGRNYFYTKGPVFNILIWQNDGYIFKIETELELSQEELYKIIDGVQLVENQEES